MLTVGSLFAGIGGFDLGLERAGMRVRWQVEIDPYCQRVLAKHWPDVTRYGDIRAVDWSTVEPVDLLCGGFPCQDISLAGKGAGLSGDRSGLWFEYAKAIAALRPRYVLIENVAALRARGLDQVLGGLAALGYDAEWSVLSACAFGASHTRERLFIVAYPNSIGVQAGYQRLRGICTAPTPSWSANQYSSSCEAKGQALSMREPEPELGRVAHGIPHRVDRLRGLGNAIVPQIATFLGERILAYDQSRTREAGTVFS